MCLKSLAIVVATRIRYVDEIVPVVQKLNNAIHRKNHYPVDKHWVSRLRLIHLIEIYAMESVPGGYSL